MYPRQRYYKAALHRCAFGGVCGCGTRAWGSKGGEEAVDVEVILRVFGKGGEVREGIGIGGTGDY